jgi:hypothetical protein
MIRQHLTQAPDDDHQATAGRRLASQDQRSRSSRRDNTDPAPARRLMRALKPAHRGPAATGGLALGTRDEAETSAGSSLAVPPRLTRLLHRLPKIGAGLYDPRLDWPNLVEDDYYRFRNQPSGW